jgi:hypothetical protein
MTVKSIVGAIACALSLALVFNPFASASPYCSQVRKQSGKVECIIGSSSVSCYASTGFQGSPSGGVDYLAIVQSDGTFTWQNAGGLGNCDGANISVLPYGSSQVFNGWNVQASDNGTTFTNQASGRGMFVSIESTHPV